VTALHELVLGRLLAAAQGLTFTQLETQTCLPAGHLIGALEDLHAQGRVTIHVSQPTWRAVRSPMPAGAIA
jgi:hypothetical protein